MFDQIKKEIIELINTSTEISRNEKNTDIGIYMLYVNNFDDNKIIPFYIGKTGSGKNRNFSKRYQEHVEQVMALNRLTYNYYTKILLDSFYEGRYKSCKIFQYMVNHNCTLDDLHMVILEKILPSDDVDEILDKKEKEYFIKYLPAFFGFNQMNAISELPKVLFSKADEDENKIYEYLLEDTENLIKYFGYGYTKFNYYHGIPKSFNYDSKGNKIDITKKKIKNNIDELANKYYDKEKFKENERLYNKYNLEKQKLEKDIKEIEDSLDKKYLMKIQKYCKENQIGINQKLGDIKRVLIYQNEEEIKKFENYLKRKKINTNIVEEFEKDKKFKELRYRLKYKQKRIIEINPIIEENAFPKRIDDLKRLLPQKFERYPLKDSYKDINFENKKKNNIILNFEFANSGRLEYIENNLIKMDYSINKDGKLIETKNIFLIPQECMDVEIYEVDYFEQDNANCFKFRKDPFIVRSFSGCITTNMEYYNGINNYTFMGRKLVEFNDVLDDINNKITNNMTIEVKARSGLKKYCKEFIKYNYKNENALKFKIIEVLS